MKGKELLKDYVFEHIPGYLMAVLLIIVANVIQSALPLVLGHFTDDLQSGLLNHDSVVRFALLLLAIGISYGVLFGLGQYQVMRLGRRFEFEVRQKLFGKFSVLSEHFFSKQGTGKLLSYVTNDVQSVRESISNGVTQTTNAVVLLLSCIFMMLAGSIPLPLILICISPLVFIPLIVVRIGPQVRKRSMSVQESLAGMTESAEEQFGGIRVSKTFGTEQIASARFGEKVDLIRSAQLFLVRLSSLFQAAIPFLGALSLVLALLVGGAQTLNGTITLGSFVSLTLYMRIIVGPLQQIGNVINMMQRSGASLERVNRLMSEVPDVQDEEDAQTLEQNCEIRFDDLSFTYPGAREPALKHIDLTIRPGQTLGIVGRTGSGKTTLVKLLLRIYEPERGSLFFGGTDIRDLSLESLRGRLAYVPQDGFLFSTTIRDNIAFSDREAPMEKVEKGAKRALIYDNIVRFPEGFDTRLGERGVTLSGGQRQRTSLARGLTKKARVLILDDSMSAVDAVTETGILDNLVRERRSKTTIIISHRISAVKHADEIVVLSEGRIVQRGTHEQLLRREGAYAMLHRLQEEGLQHGELE
ncbi:ABC transporter ATP-binding protein [Saccharibacillus sp. CPCC 101409]|uniref:ABC transporter ATP-binding protein n=1 Tax=Saccharibacillus sp. CPCC 101409 TaxID=3058041 RepID=UPI00267366C1|nr:ABC transporter ATP-binding protein [Saccharibacillus sp. CPCC 101409]MDO3408495.1 ABC transporter ATP-binding protein [Saccharibacillus sp. CPCC 101409]